MFGGKTTGSHLFAYFEFETIACQLPWFWYIAPEFCPFRLDDGKIEGKIELRKLREIDVVFIEENGKGSM